MLICQTRVGLRIDFLMRRVSSAEIKFIVTNGEPPPRTIISRWFNKGSRQLGTRYAARSKRDAKVMGGRGGGVVN